MEYTNINKILLSLVLAFRDLESSLTKEEESAIAKTAQQLSVTPQVWETKIEPNLLATISKNSSLSKLFQSYKSQIDRIDGEIPDDLLPTSADLESIENTPQMARSRAPLQVNQKDIKSKEITNMAIKVMASDSPTKTANKINSLQRIKQFLNK